MKAFWQLCESRSRRIAVYKEWVDVGGDDWELVRQLILPTSCLAASYPNPKPHRERMKIVRYPSDKLVAIDPDDRKNRIELTQQDIIFHKLDLYKLRKLLCRGLSQLRTSKSKIQDRMHVIRVGSLEFKTTAKYPVYLLLCTSHVILREKLLLLTVKHNSSGILILTPTRMRWTDEIEEIASSKRMLLVPLEAVVESKQQALQETRVWQSYLETFKQLVGVDRPGRTNIQKPFPMRATRAASIEKLEKLLEAHLIAARDYAYYLQDQGLEPTLLPRPKLKELAVLLGSHKTEVSRCLNDPRAKVLKVLWEAAGSIESVMKYQAKRKQ
ncbi:hypothetical protein KS4_10700 [Poriferisphaera corsica]|uniref:Uncharacterized protein n=1 Tax=Poriferisphaera corsica TaxID=2528020 RepID=A0A517YS31_9BACT|nr:hypothetical protein [Poriferisphaera corsica]QDU33029.1 hypothetical protein KS4_10700 [Poriferisphaera corsica]